MTQKLYEVDVLDHVEIRLSDGKKLSAKMWMPRPTEVVMEGVAEVFPVVLEAIPYTLCDFILFQMKFINQSFICHRFFHRV